jgi:hypothetical protein
LVHTLNWSPLLSLESGISLVSLFITHFIANPLIFKKTKKRSRLTIGKDVPHFKIAISIGVSGSTCTRLLLLCSASTVRVLASKLMSWYVLQSSKIEFTGGIVHQAPRRASSRLTEPYRPMVNRFLTPLSTPSTTKLLQVGVSRKAKPGKPESLKMT